MNLVQRTKRSARLSWRAACEVATQRVVPNVIDSLRLPRLDQADAYDVEPRLGVELLRGGLPEELRSPSFPPAPARSV